MDNKGKKIKLIISSLREKVNYKLNAWYKEGKHKCTN